jgi:hypothetical protein
MSTELIWYTPLTGSNTLEYAAELQGDEAPPAYSNVADFTSNVFGLQVSSNDLTNLFGEADGVRTIDTAIFTNLISGGESDFFTSTSNTVLLGGYSVPSVYSLIGVPASLEAITSNRGIVGTPTISNSGTSFADLFAQVGSNQVFIDNFYNDAQTIGGAGAASAITFLVEYDVTANYTYVLNASEYPTNAQDTLHYYYDRLTKARYSLTSLTDTTSNTVRFALKFNVGA